MSDKIFRYTLGVLGLSFAGAFSLIVLPPLLQNPDVLGAFAAGFVNPYSSGYALDAIFCWFVLAAWVIYEAKTAGIRYGWAALLLGIAPGVATGFAAYLLLRLHQQRASAT
jgi:hypothetical protein